MSTFVRRDCKRGSVWRFSFALLAFVFLPSPASSQLCQSTATIDMGDAPYCYLVCPQGDGHDLNNIPYPLSGAPHDGTIQVTVRDAVGTPIPNIPKEDFWLIGCTDALVLCNGSQAINATANTDANGQTTIEGPFAAGGCDLRVKVVVQGFIIADPSDCFSDLCLDIQVKSPDRVDAVSGQANPDLVVSLADLGVFAAAYPTPANPNPPYDPCADFDCSGTTSLLDFGLFANHWMHQW